MKCPNEVRLCPAGWSDCEYCEYVGTDDTCLYVKSDIEVVILAAEIAEGVVTEDAIESAQKIRGTWMEELDRVVGSEEFWPWFHLGIRANHANYKEPLPLDGPSAPGGGSKNKATKSKKGNKVYVNVWSGF